MATRLYGVATTAAPISPGQVTGWQSVTGFVRRNLSLTKDAATELRDNVAVTSGANNECLAFQLISEPLAAGDISGTVTIMTRGNEVAGNDNINRVSSAIQLVSNDGTVQRAVLLAQGFRGYAPATDLPATEQGIRAANADSLVTGTAFAGDRIVVELGYGMSGTGTSPQFDMVIGGNGTDHANADTDTTGTVPWIEFSANLVFATDAPAGLAAGTGDALGATVDTTTEEAPPRYRVQVAPSPAAIRSTVW